MTAPMTSDTIQGLAAPAFRTFARLVDVWGLDDSQAMGVLGAPRQAAYHNWMRGNMGGVGPREVERISLLIGIYTALHILFPSDEQADTWIKRVHNAGPFSGSSALDHMSTGSVSGLWAVRAYLSAQAGGV